MVTRRWREFLSREWDVCVRDAFFASNRRASGMKAFPTKSRLRVGIEMPYLGSAKLVVSAVDAFPTRS